MRIVVKVEIETLFDESGKFSPVKMEQLAMICTNLQNSGASILIVSSGAIALGAAMTGLRTIPAGITAKQAIAAIGQAELIRTYQDHFDNYDQTVAQVLLTEDVTENPVRNMNAGNTLVNLMNRRIIPIINENDSVSTNDIILNDNYPLVLMVTSLTDAGVIAVNTYEGNKFLLLFRNSSAAREVTTEELLDLPGSPENGSSDLSSDITGFPPFPPAGHNNRESDG